MGLPLRVLHYNHTSTVSGAEISLLTLAEALPQGHTAIVAAPEGDLLTRARAAGLPTVACRGTSGSLALHPWRTPVAVMGMVVAGAQLARVARSRRADVIHANSPRSGLIASVARRLGGPPIVVHVRDAAPPSRIGRLIFRAIGPRSSLVAISDFVAQGLAKQVSPGTRVAVVFNPVREGVFFPDQGDGLAWRETNGLPRGALVLAVVGQITSWKRQRFAVDVLGVLRRSGIDAHLLVIGEIKFDSADTRLDNPAYLRSIRERAQETDVRGAVRLLGERHDVASAMRAADVLLAPAEREPFGRAVAEAMLAGLPVLVPNGPGGPTEFVRDGPDGRLLDSHDDHVWADAAWRAAAMRPTPGGRERARILFSAERHAERMIEIFRAALPH